MKTLTLLLALVAGMTVPEPGYPQVSAGPDTVIVHSGPLRLRALVWRPGGPGPFPAVLFNHASYGTPDPLPPGEPAVLGPVFASHGYVFLFPFRRGIGLSADQGAADGDLMDRAMEMEGPQGLNRIQLELLTGEELDEVTAALAFLRALPAVDQHRVAVAGHSFGGSLSLLLAERDTAVRAVVLFAGAAYSWERSPGLRTRLLAAARHAPAALFLHAANDYSTVSGTTLAAEMRRLGRPHGLKIYPAAGRSPREGHNFLYRDVATWERDVFDFLGSRLRN